MLLPTPPMSNTERQREFRERNPGYYQRLHAKRRAKIRALQEARLVASEQAMATKPEPLMLPAPAVIVEIPGMTTIPAIPALSALVVSEQATIPSPAKSCTLSS